MPEDLCAERPLFGGAIVSTFPLRFQDVSNIRQVPDHQEVFVDLLRDESLIFELLDLKTDVADQGSATWFLQDLANEQDAEGTMVLEQSGVFEADGLRCRSSPAIITTAVGQMAISKGRQGREAQNIVKVYLANLRLKDVATDVLITAYEPMLIKYVPMNKFVLVITMVALIHFPLTLRTQNLSELETVSPLSETAATVGAGLPVPAAQSGCLPMADVFKSAVTSFKVNDWSLFGAVA
ncbi:UNVERIFIED_CONTAM: Ran guanine nucleotide release factor [Sesamum radiatum]|uniref:Ran guanine nucleotide release factor n=1 Tax=Sesamum radiatum TaxID=300843 RepID=A0AAW2S061_SESRA